MAEGDYAEVRDLEGQGVYDVKTSGIQIEIKPGYLLVRQRRVGTKSLLMVLFLGCLYCASSLLRLFNALVTALASRDWATASIVSTLLLAALLSLAGLLFGLFTAQVLKLDAQQLQLARKEVFRPWRRSIFETGAIQKMKHGIIRQSATEVVRGLVIEFSGHTEGIFPYLSPLDGDDILKACEAFGIPTEHDPAVHMLRDVQQHGWFVNPWRPDDAQTHPKEQQ
jgi:hypothetical protein